MNNQKEEWAAVISNKIEKSQKYHAEQKLAGTQEYIFDNPINFQTLE